MGLRLSQNLRLEQSMNLSQRIGIANLIKLPDSALVVENAIGHAPDKVEDTLVHAKSSLDEGVDAKVRTLCGSFGSSGSKGEGKGMIISPDVRSIEDVIGDHDVKILPDVIFRGRENNKPEIVFSDYLRGTIELKLKMVDRSKHPETAKLLSQLARFRDWRNEKLRLAYTNIGEEHREYFEHFDCSKINIFTYERLASKLEIHECTVYRLLENRLVEARDVSGDVLVLTAKSLLPTKVDVLRLQAMNTLNEVLASEFREGITYSDQQFSDQVKGLARRTIAKYRDECGIPGKNDRQAAYKCGDLVVPYKFYDTRDGLG